MKISVIALGLLGLASVSRANDFGIDGIGGSPKPLKGEHRSIRMESETIRVDLYRDYYDTRAEFVFRNNGGAQNVAMAFPESGMGDTGNGNESDTVSAFKFFRTSVDGRTLKVRRVLQSEASGGPGYDALWVKSVPFARNQRRRVRVSYRSGYGGGTPTFQRVASYSFTGKNWRGNVARSVLRAVWHTPGTIVYDANSNKHAKSVRRIRNGLEWNWTNWSAQAEWDLVWARTIAGWRQTNDDWFWKPSEAELKTITIAGRETPWRAREGWLPSVWMENGVAWMPLETADRFWKERGGASLKFDKETETGTFSTGEWKFIFNPHSILMHFSQASALDTNQAVALPANPRLINGQMVVPASAMLRLLNAQILSPPRAPRQAILALKK